MVGEGLKTFQTSLLWGGQKIIIIVVVFLVYTGLASLCRLLQALCGQSPFPRLFFALPLFQSSGLVLTESLARAQFVRLHTSASKTYEALSCLQLLCNSLIRDHNWNYHYFSFGVYADGNQSFCPMSVRPDLSKSVRLVWKVKEGSVQFFLLT